MEEIKNYLIENNYVVRVLENDLTRLLMINSLIYMFPIERVNMNQQLIYTNDKIKHERLQHRYPTRLK